jgi:excisionase family DNA binding protein
MTSATELLTVADVARICRVHEATVRRHIASGRLRSVRVGRGIRVRTEDLKRFMESPVLPGEDPGKFKPFTEDDPLWNIVGIIADDEPWVSGDKYRALADAYSKKQ